MTRVCSGVRGSLETMAGVESRLIAALGAASDEVAHSECLDEEDRSEVYAILQALSGETEAHRQTVESLNSRLAEGGDA